jgi:hypothetical protein
MLARRFGFFLDWATTSRLGGVISDPPQQRFATVGHTGGDGSQRALPADRHPSKPIVVDPQDANVAQFSRRAFRCRPRQRREDG